VKKKYNKFYLFLIIVAVIDLFYIILSTSLDAIIAGLSIAIVIKILQVLYKKTGGVT
jgi:hypothetical protein